ncbi:hypothetical protein L218DRAFT_23490 [Marasmius fiardii PR-910]|nr:hypothetical protein L218DRAFT_23490 [Marasmius fiardii PR-910]
MSTRERLAMFIRRTRSPGMIIVFYPCFPAALLSLKTLAKHLSRMLPLIVYDDGKYLRLSGRRRKRMGLITGNNFHPLLFALMTLSAAAELGLTSYLVAMGNEDDRWPGAKYRALLILFMFNASWTLLFSSAYMMYIFDGGVHFLANVASSVVWILLTGVLWGTAAGLLHGTRIGGNCAGAPAISECRQSLTVEALGWTELGLCVLNLILTCLWIHSSTSKSSKKLSFVGDSRRMV